MSCADSVGRKGLLRQKSMPRTLASDPLLGKGFCSLPSHFVVVPRQPFAQPNALLRRGCARVEVVFVFEQPSYHLTPCSLTGKPLLTRCICTRSDASLSIFACLAVCSTADRGVLQSCPLAFPRPGESNTVENWAEKLNVIPAPLPSFRTVSISAHRAEWR